MAPLARTRFVDATTTFLRHALLDDAQEVFRALLRDEQTRRGAHVLCLPAELRLLIVRMAHDGSAFRVHRHAARHLDVLGRDGLQLLRDDAARVRERWRRMKHACSDLVAMVPDPHRFPLIVLATTRDAAAAAAGGTSRGRHVLAVVETDAHARFSRRLCDTAERLVCGTEPMSVSVHECALVAKHRRNPFDGEEEFVSVETKWAAEATRVVKIWWVRNQRTNSVSCAV